MVAGPVLLTGAIWKLSELLKNCSRRPFVSHGLGQVTDRGTGNRHTARSLEEQGALLLWQKYRLGCQGGTRNTSAMTEIQIQLSGRNKEHPCLWQKYRLGSWEGTRSTPAMTETQIRALSPLPQEQDAAHGL